MNFVDENIERMYKDAVAYQEKIVEKIEELKNEGRRSTHPRPVHGQYTTKKQRLIILKKDLSDSKKWVKMLDEKRFKYQNDNTN